MPALQEYINALLQRERVSACIRGVNVVLSKFHDQPFLTPGPSIVQLAAPLTLFCSAILFCYLLPTCNIALFAVASASCCYVDGQFFLPCSGCGE